MMFKNFLICIFTFVVIFSLIRKVSTLIKGRSKNQTTIVDPIKETLDSLKIVKKSIGKDSYETFAVLLSNTLKKYLSYEFKYIKNTYTNDEILKKFNSDIKNDWEDSSSVTEILSLTEKVKFAKKKLSILQQRSLYKKTCLIILRIWRTRRKINANK